MDWPISTKLGMVMCLAFSAGKDFPTITLPLSAWNLVKTNIKHCHSSVPLLGVAWHPSLMVKGRHQPDRPGNHYQLWQNDIIFNIYSWRHIISSIQCNWAVHLCHVRQHDLWQKVFPNKIKLMENYHWHRMYYSNMSTNVCTWTESRKPVIATHSPDDFG